MTINELLQKYANGKDKLSQLKADYDIKEKDIKDGLERIAVTLQAYAQQEGLDKLVSPDFSMSWTQTSHPRISDSEAFYDYIIKTKQFDLLEKRPAKLNVLRLIAAGQVLPGIDVFNDTRANFRKRGANDA